jgi:hypothetical protein
MTVCMKRLLVAQGSCRIRDSAEACGTQTCPPSAASCGLETTSLSAAREISTAWLGCPGSPATEIVRLCRSAKIASTRMGPTGLAVPQRGHDSEAIIRIGVVGDAADATGANAPCLVGRELARVRRSGHGGQRHKGKIPVHRVTPVLAARPDLASSFPYARPVIGA